jgi:hypothetical protein
MNTITKLSATLLVTLAAAVSTAQAATVATWTFETSLPLTAGPFSPEVGAGSALGFHVGGATAYSNPVGNGSAESFSSNTWAVGDYYQFSVSTAGFTDLALSWDQASSGTGPRDFTLSYSTNGTTFTNFASYQVLVNGSPNVAWSSATYNPAFTFSQNLAAVDTLENQATVYFRLVNSSTASAAGGVVAATGTNRVDNFTVSATPSPVPVPAAVWLLGSGLLGLARMGRRRTAC